MRWPALALAALWAGAGSAQAAPGSLDRSFGGDGLVHADIGGTDHAQSVAVLPDGSIVVGGYADVAPSGNGRQDPGNLDLALARFAHAGRLAARSTLGVAGHDEAHAMAVAPDGSVLLAGQSRLLQPAHTVLVRGVVARFRPDGTPDRAFGAGGAALLSLGADALWFGAGLVHWHADGRITVAGRRVGAPGTSSLVLARLLADGRPDASFGAVGVRTIAFHGGATPTAFALDHAGRLLVAGADPPPALDQRMTVIVQRFTLDGALDSGFGTQGTAVLGSETSPPAALALQRDGAVLAALPSGRYRETGRLVRLLATGAPDPSFGTGGGVPTMTPSSLVVDPEDRIVVGGPDFAVTRHEPDGARDGRFRPAAIPRAYRTTYGTDLALAPGGELVAAGWMQARRVIGFEAPYHDFGVARFHGGDDADSPRLYLRARTRRCVGAALRLRLRARDASGVSALLVRVDRRLVARSTRAARRCACARAGCAPDPTA